MLLFPLYILLIPYVLFAAYIAVLALLNIRHLIHYGAATLVSFVITFAYLAGSVFIVNATYRELSDLDWKTPQVIRLELPGAATFNQMNDAQP